MTDKEGEPDLKLLKEIFLQGVPHVVQCSYEIGIMQSENPESGSYGMFLPENLSAWTQEMQVSMEKSGLVVLAITNKTDAPQTVAVAFLSESESGKSAFHALQDGEAFGFITNIATIESIIEKLQETVDTSKRNYELEKG